MNNATKITLQNGNGATKTFGQIPDLWHLIEKLEFDDNDPLLAEKVKEVWDMAHFAKDVFEGQGKAKLISIEPPK